MKRLEMKTLDEAFVEGKAPPFSLGRRMRKKNRRRLEAAQSPPLLARGDGLEFPSIFVPENERTFVHLAKAV
jgi:hypothetical protein